MLSQVINMIIRCKKLIVEDIYRFKVCKSHKYRDIQRIKQKKEKAINKL